MLVRSFVKNRVLEYLHITPSTSRHKEISGRERGTRTRNIFIPPPSILITFSNYSVICIWVADVAGNHGMLQ